MFPLSIESAKEKLTIHDLWRHLDLPGEPKVSCCSPFREERSPSFSVSADGKLWNDFGAGEGGDAIDFYQTATGLSRREACRRFIELAGGRVSDTPPLVQRRTAAPQVRQAPVLPSMHRGSRAEMEAIASLRNLSVEACMIADEIGLLRFGAWKGEAAWFVTDDDRKSAQARRTDGRQWEGIGAKAQTLPGSWAKLPVGHECIGGYPFICLVEGGPDLLAACHFIHKEGREGDCCPVGMLGASMLIDAEALPSFSGRRVRIFPDADQAGLGAAKRWAKQLAGVGAQVDAVNLSGLRKADGSPIKDLNDCTQIHPDDAGKLEGLLPR